MAENEVPVPENIDPEALAALQNLEERRKEKRRKRLIKILVICGIALLLLIGVVASCVGAAVNGMKEEVKPEVAAVARETLESSVQATGALKPGVQVAVTPEVSGIIQEVLVSEGQHVEAGDVLFTLRNTDVERTLSNAESALNRARRSLSDAQANAQKARDEYDDAVNSYNAQVDEVNEAINGAEDAANEAYNKAYNKAIAAIPKDATKEERERLIKEAKDAAQLAYDAVFTEIDARNPGEFDHSMYEGAIASADSAVTSAADGVEDAQEAYGSAAEEAGKRTVRAPIAGSVLDLQATPGAAVGGATGGTSTAKSETLAMVADLSGLSVDVEVNEVDISNVAVGQPVTLTFTAVPGLELQGRVASVASVSTGSGGDATATGGGGGVVTFKVSITVDTPDERLKPGMSASINIITKEVPDVLVVPAAAVTEENGAAYVTVVSDEKATGGETREVTIADRTTREVAIASGLEEGELVLVGVAAGAGPSASGSSSAAGAR